MRFRLGHRRAGLPSARFTVIWLVVGIGLLTTFVVVVSKTSDNSDRLRAHGVREAGTITHLSADSGFRSGRGWASYQVGSRTLVGSVDLGSDVTNYHIGQTVTVYYDPDHPSNMTIDDEDNEAALSVLLTIVALVLGVACTGGAVLTGGVALVRRWRPVVRVGGRRRRIRRGELLFPEPNAGGIDPHLWRLMARAVIAASKTDAHGFVRALRVFGNRYPLPAQRLFGCYVVFLLKNRLTARVGPTPQPADLEEIASRIRPRFARVLPGQADTLNGLLLSAFGLASDQDAVTGARYTFGATAAIGVLLEGGVRELESLKPTLNAWLARGATTLRSACEAPPQP